SPVGKLTLRASEKGIRAVLFDGPSAEPARPAGKKPTCLTEAKRQLREYFSGRRTRFDLPLDLQGTDFQLRAWRALRKIPYGRTISYGEQARQLGSPQMARAVGGANGRNPVSIIIPCHRVVGADGTLTGFGGGLEKKRYLLDLER